MVNSNLIQSILDNLIKPKGNKPNLKLNEMASKLINQPASGQEADLVSNLNNNLKKDDLDDLNQIQSDRSINSPDHDEQDKDSINNDLNLKNNLLVHNSRNSISSGHSSTEERSDDELQPTNNLENERIQEYLNRKDTAVVYPVDVCNLNDTNQASINGLPINKQTSDQPKRKKSCKYL